MSPGEIAKWRAGHSQVDKTDNDYDTKMSINIRLNMDLDGLQVQDARGQWTLYPKRSTANTTTPSTQPLPGITLPKPADVVYPETVNFTHILENEINRWVETCNIWGDQLTRDMDIWDKRTVLQLAFGGGFTTLSKDDIGYWRDGHKGFAMHRDDGAESARTRLSGLVGHLTLGPDKRGLWHLYPKGPKVD